MLPGAGLLGTNSVLCSVCLQAFDFCLPSLQEPPLELNFSDTAMDPWMEKVRVPTSDSASEVFPPVQESVQEM